MKTWKAMYYDEEDKVLLGAWILAIALISMVVITLQMYMFEYFWQLFPEGMVLQSLLLFLFYGAFSLAVTDLLTENTTWKDDIEDIESDEDDDSEERMYSCPWCSYETHVADGLKRHLVREECSMSEECLMKEKTVRRKLRNEQENKQEQVNNSEQTYECMLCSEKITFHHEDDAKEHLATQHNDEISYEFSKENPSKEDVDHLLCLYFTITDDESSGVRR